MLERFSRLKPRDLTLDMGKQRADIAVGRHMGRDHDVFAIQERAFGGKRLGLEHIKRRAAKKAAIERLQKPKHLQRPKRKPRQKQRKPQQKKSQRRQKRKLQQKKLLQKKQPPKTLKNKRSLGS